jgi:BCD family chlorophyll transporter-like MFS transporter
MTTPSTSYGVVYHVEIALLFASLAAIGPLARYAPDADGQSESKRFGLADLPA